MIMHALQTGTPFVYEIFRIGYCTRGNCTSDKYFLFKWSTRLQSMYNHMVGGLRQLYLPFYSILLDLIVKNANANWKTILLFSSIVFLVARLAALRWQMSQLAIYPVCVTTCTCVFNAQAWPVCSCNPLPLHPPLKGTESVILSDPPCKK